MKLLIRKALITGVAAVFGRAVASCEEACRLTSAARDRPLTRGERLSIGIHNRLCRECGRYAHQLDRLCACARVEAPVAPLSDAAKQRLAAALRDAATNHNPPRA